MEFLECPLKVVLGSFVAEGAVVGRNKGLEIQKAVPVEVLGRVREAPLVELVQEVHEYSADMMERRFHWPFRVNQAAEVR